MVEEQLDSILLGNSLLTARILPYPRRLMRLQRLISILFLLLLPKPGIEVESLRADEVDFARDIRPLLSENCFFCHGPDEQQREADLGLDSSAGLAHVIVPGSREQSGLHQRLISDDPDEVMPPRDSNRSLTAAQIELIGRWIDEGAQWQTHWSFQPLIAPAVPKVNATPWAPIHSPIDAFVQSQLEGSGLHPSPEAKPHELIRRLTLDLTGLPPTPEQVRQFISSHDPHAYERLVEQLLDSPRYGERMAWDWLDAARYADTNGYQGDNERTMWPWRDWVVKAFNENLPFDQFTIWQLAGDLLPDASDEQSLATAFLRNHMINGEGGRIAEENRIEYGFDMTETTGTVWLGLTMNCCRCHDHKYDPLTQQDYYRLFAYFDQTPVTGKGRDAQTPPVLRLPSSAQSSGLEELSKSISAKNMQLKLIDRSVSERPPRPETALTKKSPPSFIESLAEYQRMKSERDALQAERDKLETLVPKVMVMEDMDTPRQTFMLERGLYNKPTTEVFATMPAFLSKASNESPNRLSLARWIVSTENPLMPRVTVNRLWQQFFGMGLVKTAEDFGAQGETPLQMDLLNWLAAHFRDSGWDVKALVRTIVTSHTYRQAAQQTEQHTELDPQNRLLARGARFRLPSWLLRDQALAASGLLSPIVSGPSINTYQPAGVWEEATFGNKKYSRGQGEELYRRSLFVFWRRIIAPTLFFDNATRQTCTVKSVRTNTPLQTLLTLNETTYVEAARTLAEQVLLSQQLLGELSTDTQRLDIALQRVVARPATAAEREILLAGLERTRLQFKATPTHAAQLLTVGDSPHDKKLDPIEHASWTIVCLTVLNLDETLNRP